MEGLLISPSLLSLSSWASSSTLTSATGPLCPSFPVTLSCCNTSVLSEPRVIPSSNRHSSDWTPSSSTACTSCLLERDLLHDISQWMPRGSPTPPGLSGCPCASEGHGDDGSRHSTQPWTPPPSWSTQSESRLDQAVITGIWWP